MTPGSPKKSPLHRLVPAFAAVGFMIVLIGTLVGPFEAMAQIIAPRLAINIPGVTFSNIQVQNSDADRGISGYMDIPWIAEYMRGVYSYAVGIAGVLAGIMVVVGGFYYLTAGGDASRVQKGKQRIADAFVGLFLVFASYTVLTTLSPGLTSFEALHIKRVKQDAYTMVIQSLMTTTATTGADGSAGTTGTPPPWVPPPGGVTPTDTPLPPPSGNNYVQLYSECPFTANLPPKHVVPCHGFSGSTGCGDEAVGGDRGQAFRTLMRAQLASVTDVRRKIAMVAEAGVKCGTHYGSCGATATTWASIAGVGPDTLGANEPSAGGSTRWEGVSHETPASIAYPLLAVACETTCSGTRFRDLCGARCDPATRPNGTVIENNYTVKRDCASGAAARAAVRAMFEGPGGPAGWPDSWTSRLEIGDHVHIYNGNSSCGASHALIFMGWVGGGRAKMAQGQWAGPQWEDTRCLMRSCGDFAIVTRIFKPTGLAH